MEGEVLAPKSESAELDAHQPLDDDANSSATKSEKEADEVKHFRIKSWHFEAESKTVAALQPAFRLE